MIPFVDLARGFRQTPDGQFTPISSDFVGAMEKIKTGAFITSKVGYRKSRQAEEVMGGQVRFDQRSTAQNKTSRNPHEETHVHVTCAGISVCAAPGRD